MEIPIGARIDRKTGVIAPLYKEGTKDDMKTLASMLIKVGLDVLRDKKEGPARELPA